MSDYYYKKYARRAPSKKYVPLAEYVAKKERKRVARKPRARRVVIQPSYEPQNNSIGSTLGTAVGGFLGGPAGAAVGSMLGSKAQDLVRAVTGFGDYKVNVNTLINEDPVPEFQSIGQRSTVVRHREFIQDVVSSATANAFELTQFRIQPGDSQTFPWLSQVAQNYEQYRFHGLLFEFKTTSGSISSTGQLGTVVLATQYNSLSSAFINKQQMENYEFASSIVASQSVVHPIECDPKQTQCNGIFNVATDITNPGDIRLYDLGRFNLATVGMPNSLETVGELWVSYDICLYKPRLFADSGNVADHYQIPASDLSGATYFGVNSKLTSGSDGITFLSAGTELSFNYGVNGNFMVNYTVFGVGGAATPADPIMTGSNGVTDLNLMDGDTVSQYSLVYQATSSNLHAIAYFSVVQPSGTGLFPTITFSAGTFPTTPTGADLIITRLPSDLN